MLSCDVSAKWPRPQAHTVGSVSSVVMHCECDTCRLALFPAVTPPLRMTKRVQMGAWPFLALPAPWLEWRKEGQSNSAHNEKTPEGKKAEGNKNTLWSVVFKSNQASVVVTITAQQPQLE